MEHNPPPRIGFACKFNRRHPCELHTIPKRVLAARDGRRPRASTMALLMAPYISNVTLVPFESGAAARRLETFPLELLMDALMCSH